MQIKSKKYRYFCWQLLLLVSSGFSCIISGTIGVANAQETVEVGEAVSQPIIVQATPSKPARPRPSFFEEERKFGIGNFLESALDGTVNYFAAESINNLEGAVNNFAANPINNFNNLANSSNDALTSATARNISGILTVQSRDKNDANFLTTTFVSDVPGLVNLTFTSPIYGIDPRIGTVTVQNNQGTLNINNGSRNYSGSFSVRNDVVSGAIQVVDPRNPSTTILIQVPPVFSSGSGDDSKPISVPASFSIGLPTDR